MNNNLLIIKHGSLGDMIRSDGIFRTIREYHKNSKIYLLTTSPYKELMLKNPSINEIIIDNRLPFFKINFYLNLRKKLNNLSFFRIYDLQNSQRTFFYRKLLLPNSNWISTKREIHPISGIQGLSDMLAKNNIPNNFALKSDLSWLANDIKNIIKAYKIPKKYILMIPGSSRKHPEKRWPFFPELINLLIKEKYSVISILGPDEIELEEKIPGIILKNLNWGDLAGIIKNAAFIFSNDTGPIHIAACMKKRGLIFFGPTTSPAKVGLELNNFIIKNTKDLRSLKASEVIKDFKSNLG